MQEKGTTNFSYVASMNSLTRLPLKKVLLRTSSIRDAASGNTINRLALNFEALADLSRLLRCISGGSFSFLRHQSA